MVNFFFKLNVVWSTWQKLEVLGDILIKTIFSYSNNFQASSEFLIINLALFDALRSTWEMVHLLMKGQWNVTRWIAHEWLDIIKFIREDNLSWERDSLSIL